MLAPLRAVSVIAFAETNRLRTMNQNIIRRSPRINARMPITTPSAPKTSNRIVLRCLGIESHSGRFHAFGLAGDALSHNLQYRLRFLSEVAIRNIIILRLISPIFP
jgi:hypothetical protein